MSSAARLETALEEMAAGLAVALDTESNSFYRYPEQLCLVQIATARRVYLLDALALGDLAPLGRITGDPAIQKVIHGADYDVRSLDRHASLRVRNVFDTSIAARFAGLEQVGLAALAEGLLGVKLDKSKRLQRADWGLRPLSRELLEYAAADVRHLLALRDILAERLGALGRAEWVAEECARLEEVRHAPPDTELAFLAVKGSRDLDGRGLAVLHALCAWREAEARRLQRPHFHIVSDAALAFLAAHPHAELSAAPGLGESAQRRYGRAIREALKAGLAAPPLRRPPSSSLWVRPTAEQNERLRRLKEWRAAQGRALELDPALLWPMASLERLARAPATLRAELAAPEVRRWQRERFGEQLREWLEK
ncbi:MAG: HRDC domain-containing protein [Chloroflexi bacterium]|nr:HRDC domain-containing protein [Chloroflexota bacterium]